MGQSQSTSNSAGAAGQSSQPVPATPANRTNAPAEPSTPTPSLETRSATTPANLAPIVPASELLNESPRPSRSSSKHSRWPLRSRHKSAAHVEPHSELDANASAAQPSRSWINRSLNRFSTGISQAADRSRASASIVASSSSQPVNDKRREQDADAPTNPSVAPTAVDGATDNNATTVLAETPPSITSPLILETPGQSSSNAQPAPVPIVPVTMTSSQPASAQPNPIPNPPTTSTQSSPLTNPSMNPNPNPNTQRFPPSGTLVVVQGVVHTSDTPAPPPPQPTPRSRPRSFLRPASVLGRRAARGTSSNRSSMFGGSGSDSNAELPSEHLFSSSDGSSTSDNHHNHNHPHPHNDSDPPSSGSSQDEMNEHFAHSVTNVLGTLLSIATAATAASLVTGSTEPLFNGFGGSPADAQNPTAQSGTPPNADRGRMRNTLDILRDRLRSRRRTPQEETLDSQERLISEMARLLSSRLDARTGTGAGAGAGTNNPSSEGRADDSSAPAGDASTSTSHAQQTSQPAPNPPSDVETPLGDSSAANASTSGPSTSSEATAPHASSVSSPPHAHAHHAHVNPTFGPNRPQDSDHSFTRFLANLQEELRTALIEDYAASRRASAAPTPAPASTPSVATPPAGVPSAATPASAGEAQATAQASSSAPSDGAPVADSNDVGSKSAHADQESSTDSTSNPSAGAGAAAGASAAESTSGPSQASSLTSERPAESQANGLPAPPAPATTTPTTTPGINWWRLYRFPPMQMPALPQGPDGVPANPSATGATGPTTQTGAASAPAGPVSATASTEAPSFGANATSAFGQPGSQTSSAQPDAQQPPQDQQNSNMIVPVIVVGLQSVPPEQVFIMPGVQSVNDPSSPSGGAESGAGGAPASGGIPDLFLPHPSRGAPNTSTAESFMSSSSNLGSEGPSRERTWRNAARSAFSRWSTGARRDERSAAGSGTSTSDAASSIFGSSIFGAVPGSSSGGPATAASSASTIGAGASTSGLGAGLGAGGAGAGATPRSGSSRTYLIFVIGGYYPPNHSIVTGGNEMNSFEALWELAELLGQVKPPIATREEIDNSGLEIIKTRDLKSYSASGKVSETTSERCLICLDDYEEDDDLRLMSCKHIFHKRCVDQWLEKGRNNCPACRTKGVRTAGDDPSPQSTPQPATTSSPPSS